MCLEGKLNWKLTVLVGGGGKHHISSARATNQNLILIKARKVIQAPLISFQFKYLSKAIETVALLRPNTLGKMGNCCLDRIQ